MDEALVKSPDWVRHILGRRMEADPGTRFAYSSASSHLLSAMVATVSGQSTRADLFDPLGIHTDGAYESVESDHIPAAVIEAYQRGQGGLGRGSSGLSRRGRLAAAARA